MNLTRARIFEDCDHRDGSPGDERDDREVDRDRVGDLSVHEGGDEKRERADPEQGSAQSMISALRESVPRACRNPSHAAGIIAPMTKTRSVNTSQSGNSIAPPH